MTKPKCVVCDKAYEQQRKEQEICSTKCLIQLYDGLMLKSRAIARKYALQLGYKSMSEVKFAYELEQAGLKFDYEPDTFQYQYDPQSYTPDFRLRYTNTGSRHARKRKFPYLEYKGKLDRGTQRMLLAVRKRNPTLDLRLVFEKPNNKIYKGSKTTYSKWAEKHGFTWYDKKEIHKIKEDLDI